MGSSFDFSAPVIHFGTSREAVPRQAHKEQHFVRSQDEKNHALLLPSSKEQKLLSLYIGNIPEDLDDYWVERLLKAAAKLKQWRRPHNGTADPCSFGFAEYEDPENVNRAFNLLNEVVHPSRLKSDLRMFLITRDQASKTYVEECLKFKQYSETKDRNALSSAQGQIEKVLKDFSNPKFVRADDADSKASKTKKSVPTMESANAVTIMLFIEDELGDIPEEYRESIAQEITSFRERSAKRDQDRARQIAEVESRRLEYERTARQNELKPVNVTSVEDIAMIRRPRRPKPQYGGKPISEVELAQQKAARTRNEALARYTDEKYRWVKKEKARLEVLAREKQHQSEESKRSRSEKEKFVKMVATFDDDRESHRASQDYYMDHATWLRNRQVYRAHEAEDDLRDRTSEELEKKQSKPQLEKSMVSSERRTPPVTSDEHPIGHSGPLRLSLAKKNEDRSRLVINAEALLEDGDANTTPKRVLVPLDYSDSSDLLDSGTSHAREVDLRAIAQQIPTSREELYNYNVGWAKLNDAMIPPLRSFVTKKIVEAVGMEEEDLIDMVVTQIMQHKQPMHIEQELTAAMGDADESQLTTQKIWRYLLIVLETS